MAFQYPIVAFYSAIYALLVIYYTAMAGLTRRKLKVALGDGTFQIITEHLEKNNSEDVSPEDSRYFELTKSIRTHANYVENMPYILLMAFIAEANDAPGTKVILYIVLSAFFIGRICHGIGLHSKDSLGIGRSIGVMATVLSYLVLAGLNLYSFSRSFMN
ncbi:hypothetical protein HK098_000290 [Nowakowskiella sp. JEL0407]|nr:hypothetical protein HK098_000290 [Nowakowskiella sp. JEL0407]